MLSPAHHLVATGSPVLVIVAPIAELKSARGQIRLVAA
jgi:hypothetical protein